MWNIDQIDINKEERASNLVRMTQRWIMVKSGRSCFTFVERDHEKTELQNYWDYFYHKIRETRVFCLNNNEIIIEKYINEMFIKEVPLNWALCWEKVRQGNWWQVCASNQKWGHKRENKVYNGVNLNFMLEGGSEKCTLVRFAVFCSLLVVGYGGMR